MSRVRPSIRKYAAALLVSLAFLPGIAIEQELQLDHRLNEHIVQVPAGPTHQSMMETTVYQPNGPGPFPLLIINHGKDPGLPSAQPRDRFYHMAAAFVKRGYAVMVPMRQGFASSTGRYRDHRCNMTANGYTQANDVLDAVNYAREQPWVDGSRIIVAGQSYGGLATIALGTQALPGVRGLINFAGGLRDDSNGCDWKSELVSAFANYGANNKIPSLWMYGVNDSLFGPDLAMRLHAAFELAGGRGKLVEFGPFKRDSHGMLASRDGEKVWLADTEEFLQQVGMPTKVLYDIPPPPMPARTDFAALDDINAVPYVSAAGREAYRDYLTKLTPRAFAVSAGGSWTWAEEGEDPAARALATCNSRSTQPCRLYSMDEQIVWQGEQAEKAAVTAQLDAPQSPAASKAGAVGSTASNGNGI